MQVIIRTILTYSHHFIDIVLLRYVVYFLVLILFFIIFLWNDKLEIHRKSILVELSSLRAEVHLSIFMGTESNIKCIVFYAYMLSLHNKTAFIEFLVKYI